MDYWTESKTAANNEPKQVFRLTDEALRNLTEQGPQEIEHCLLIGGGCVETIHDGIKRHSIVWCLQRRHVQLEDEVRGDVQ